MPRRVHIRPEVEQLITELLGEEITAASPPDPFGLDHDCLNPAGHQFVRICTDIVCPHCARIAWQ